MPESEKERPIIRKENNTLLALGEIVPLKAQGNGKVDENEVQNQKYR